VLCHTAGPAHLAVLSLLKSVRQQGPSAPMQPLWASHVATRTLGLQTGNINTVHHAHMPHMNGHNCWPLWLEGQSTP
jgi:hypothetical protein